MAMMPGLWGAKKSPASVKATFSAVGRKNERAEQRRHDITGQPRLLHGRSGPVAVNQTIGKKMAARVRPSSIVLAEQQAREATDVKARKKAAARTRLCGHYLVFFQMLLSMHDEHLMRCEDWSRIPHRTVACLH